MNITIKLTSSAYSSFQFLGIPPKGERYHSVFTDEAEYLVSNF